MGTWGFCLVFSVNSKQKVPIQIALNRHMNGHSGQKLDQFTLCLTDHCPSVGSTAHRSAHRALE